ncbi:unnamed protein product [Brassicogethes aeneus]|uniref:CWF19-like protein 1 n=1 Tax=Brassicogethes aeneus TaxID=1431903 RepID=A0A9P0B444_BRAAE|nr:unnamed protein product [Brassicogethes aeneus]
MSDKQKILICGDVEGQFDLLFKRIENIHKKSGPFDLLLCVGNFFGINNKEFTPYKLGSKIVPIPTYILGPNKEEHIPLYPKDDSEIEICNNLYYLGKRGIYTDAKGVKIAYISGLSGEISNNITYTAKDASDLHDICIKGNSTFRGVDILVCSQWPSGIVEENQKLPPLHFGSDLPSYLCTKLKPRYIASGLEGIYYERSPFRCPIIGDHDTTIESVTRFIGMGRVGNPNKEKWIYALSLTPMDKMKISELLQKTTNETPCPFNYYELNNKIFKNKRKMSNQQQYFYDVTSAEENPTKQNSKKHKIQFDQSKCWFCLASPSLEKHLIINVGNLSYLAAAKGGIVDEHFLICPIEHYQSSLGQPDDVVQEINQYKIALKKFYSRKNTVPIFFERNYKTSHMQLQAVPIPSEALKELKEIFIEESAAQGFKLEELDSYNRLDQVIPPKTTYFSVEFPDGSILYTKLQGLSGFPLNFAREVLASSPILNLPNRVEWKDCILNKDQDVELVKRIRMDFEPFNFTI